MSYDRPTVAQPEQPKWLLLAWAACTAIAVFLALQIGDASLRDGVYHPVGNDAFYHARRIIDTAGERGFYEFDDTIHVPEGSQITWPWAYDYLMGKLLAAHLALNPDADPMRFLAMVPPFVLVANVALFFMLSGAVGLSAGLRAVATLAYAMFPFTQLMHGTGAIDHHYIEHSFVLLATLLALRWARHPDARGSAIALAIVLGLAPAFHNGLFVLQLPLLLGLGVAWLRGLSPSRGAALAFAITLPLTTLIISIPSAPFRAGAFDYSLLSGYHVYVAFCTGAMTALLARVEASRRGFGIATAAAAVLAAPILLTAGGGVAFLSGDIMLFDRIEEARSPVPGLFEPVRSSQLVMLYSLLIYLVPVLALWYAWRLAADKQFETIMIAAAGVFGLVLMLVQLRMQYFGSFALLLALPLMLERHLPKMRSREALASLIMLAVVAVAWQRPLRYQLFASHDLSFDVDYEIAVDLFTALGSACDAAPGLALASNNFGHPVRYHSACSVIANNFLLTPQHEDKIRELQQAWSLSPEALVEMRPDIDYVLVVLNDLYLYTETGLREPTLDELSQSNPPLAMALTLDPNLPANFELIAERPLDDGRPFAAARLFRIRHGAQSAQHTENP
ncbi:MAG: hypothetical protein AAFS02_11185 [Pseudomonadota bacterium]